MKYDVSDFLFGPMHFSRRDLGALSIMRGRDNGLLDYNTARKFYNMPFRNWTEINPSLYEENPEVQFIFLNDQTESGFIKFFCSFSKT